jgi:hypothetical protein
MKHKLKEHELSLERAVEREKWDEDDLYKNHLLHKDELRSLIKDIFDFKKELFAFAEKYI